MPLARRPFTADRVDPLLAFCARHPANPFTEDLRRAMLTRFVTGPDGVIELTRGDETAALAVAIDGVSSVADCAVLDLLGARGRAPVDPILDAAEPYVARGPRAGLEVPLTRHTAHWRPRLVARGYTQAYTSYEMETDPRPPPPEAPLPGPEWRWVEAGPERAEAYHRAVGRAMGPVPGAYLMSLDDFRRAVTEGRRDAVLLCGERVAGFAAVGAPVDGVGRVNLIGRDPDFRGRGLGPVVLARALNRLAGQGAARFALDVTASNAAALDLYRRHGFAVVDETPVFRRRRPPLSAAAPGVSGPDGTPSTAPAPASPGA